MNIDQERENLEKINAELAAAEAAFRRDPSPATHADREIARQKRDNFEADFEEAQRQHQELIQQSRRGALELQLAELRGSYDPGRIDHAVSKVHGHVARLREALAKELRALATVTDELTIQHRQIADLEGQLHLPRTRPPEVDFEDLFGSGSHGETVSWAADWGGVGLEHSWARVQFQIRASEIFARSSGK